MKPAWNSERFLPLIVGLAFFTIAGTAVLVLRIAMRVGEDRILSPNAAMFDDGKIAQAKMIRERVVDDIVSFTQRNGRPPRELAEIGNAAQLSTGMPDGLRLLYRVNTEGDYWSLGIVGKDSDYPKVYKSAKNHQEWYADY